MENLVEFLNDRMSLRIPQKDSLKILEEIIKTNNISKNNDTKKELLKIQKKFPNVKDFERDFISVCFSLATGVGKTRLMGAFITYLYISGISKNFLIVAPNTTIYEKLINDFSSHSNKYVFKGLDSVIKNKPIIVTGDTWDQGISINENLFGEDFKINIFNIDKINKEKGRIRKTQEYLGQSYFEYLSSLNDLILLLDEAHRYKAKSGYKTLTEINPILSLELTATAKHTGNKQTNFKNIIYSYNLAKAMRDGYIKIPSIVTRKNFDVSKLNQDKIDLIKLEDAIHCHEDVKSQLKTYSINYSKKYVKPFILVVAQNTKHSEKLKKIISSEKFFNGNYKKKVIEIHTNLKGEESEIATKKLLEVEKDNDTEIVIHVNKLKEGWDVNNLYTIVPLRASASDILTEQTLGRGLRLPYGKITKNNSIDTLRILAHDNFEKIVEYSKKENNEFNIKFEYVGKDSDISNKENIIINSNPYSFYNNQNDDVSKVAYEYLSSLTNNNDLINNLNNQEFTSEIVGKIIEKNNFENNEKNKSSINKSLKNLLKNSIKIPKIKLFPKENVEFGFNSFDLQNLSEINFQPIEDDIIIQRITDDQRTFLQRKESAEDDNDLKVIILKKLISYSEIDYEKNSELLFKLINQLIIHLKNYLKTNKNLKNVILNYSNQLSYFIYQQLKKNIWFSKPEYNFKLISEFNLQKNKQFLIKDKTKILKLNNQVEKLKDINEFVFSNLKKCTSDYVKFDSDPERKFAYLLDVYSDNVKKWMRPSKEDIEIEWENGKYYEPDFIFELENFKIIAEVKDERFLDNDEVKKKMEAALKWINYVNKINKEKIKWIYLLIPDTEIKTTSTIDSFIKKFKKG